MPSPSTITTATRGALLILEAAEVAGLPLPFDVAVSEYGVNLQFRSLDDLNTWAIYVEQPISESLHQGNTSYWCRADLFEQPIRLAAYITAEQVCA